MLPCVGQGALGIEVRENDERLARICERLNHFDTEQCVTGERAFLAEMGGGCASPVAAYAEMVDDAIQMRAISFPEGIIRRAVGKCHPQRCSELGRELAAVLKDETLTGGNSLSGIHVHREASTATFSKPISHQASNLL